MDQGNTMDPELELYDAAFMSYSLPLAVPVSGEHNSSLRGTDGGVLTIHSKDAHGSGEHASVRYEPNWSSMDARVQNWTSPRVTPSTSCIS